MHQRLAILSLVALMPACDIELDLSTENLGIFEVNGLDGTTRSFAVIDQQTMGADPYLLGPTAGAVASVRYEIGAERRAYLFDGDLRAGITGGNALQLPQLDAGEEERWEELGKLGSNWNSARVYDSGFCSLLIGWTDGVGLGGFLGLPALTTLITNEVDAAVLGADGLVGPVRVGAATVQPVLRAQRSGPSLSDDKDAIVFTADYHTDVFFDHIVNIECKEIDISLSFELGFERLPGAISNAPSCQQDGDPGGFLQTNDGFTYDHTGVVYDVQVNVPQYCVLPIADALSNAIRTRLPDIFERAIRDAALVDPTLFGFEPQSCTCDDDCNEFADEGPVYGHEAGRRPRCHFEGEPAEGEGQCWVQLEIDRINTRPEGLEAVLIEDEDDRQLALIEDAGLDFLLCGDGRPDVLFGAPVMSTLPYPFSVP